MNCQKVVIIDDTPTAITELTEELQRYENLKVVGYAQTQEKAIKLIRKENPDIVFLDVQLEIDRVSGFDLLRELKELKLLNFIVVFYTAYEKYAIDAIRASAFDFLTKPIDPLQLSVVVSRIQSNLLSNTNTNIEKLIDQLCPSRKIGLQTIKDIRFVKLQSIVFIQLEKEKKLGFGHIVVHLIDGNSIKLASSTTLKKLKRVINDENFFEISRQTIVNLHYLEEVENGHEHHCVMCDPYSGVQLKISRNQMSELRRKFSLI